MADAPPPWMVQYSTEPKKPMLLANITAVCLIEPALSSIEIYIVEIGIFNFFGSCDLDLDPMTFIYELDS